MQDNLSIFSNTLLRKNILRKTFLFCFLLISVFLVLFLSSCTKTEKEKAQQQESKMKDSEKEAEEETEVAGNNTDKEKIDASEEGNIPHFFIKEVSVVRTDEEDGASLYRIQSHYLRLKEKGKQFDPLREALKNYNQEISTSFDETKKSMDSLAEEEKTDRLDGREELLLRDETKTYILQANQVAVSVLNYRESELNRAKTNYSRSSANFDTVSGKRLVFSDVVKKDEEFFKLVDSLCELEYPEVNIEKPSEYAKQLKEDEYKNLVWTICPLGVTVYFDTYTLGRFTDGPQVITVPFEGNEALFNDEYIFKGEDFILPMIPGNSRFNLDLKGNGKKDYVSTESIFSQNEETLYIYESGLKVRVGDLQSMDLLGYFSSAYLLCKSGKYYLYAFVTDELSAFYCLDLANLENEEEDYAVFTLSGRDSSWDQMGDLEISGFLEETLTDPDSFIGEETSFILDRFGMEREYFAGEDGKPQAKEERGKIKTFDLLKLKKDLTCEVLDINGKEKGAIKKLQAGSYILFLYSDGDNWIDVCEIPEEEVDVFEGSYGNLYSPKNDDFMEQYEGDCYRINLGKNENGDVVFANDIKFDEVFDGMSVAG